MNIVKTIKYYLNDNRTWILEIDGDELWLRTDKSYHRIDLELLKKMHCAAEDLIKEINEEKNCE